MIVRVLIQQYEFKNDLWGNNMPSSPCTLTVVADLAEARLTVLSCRHRNFLQQNLYMTHRNGVKGNSVL